MNDSKILNQELTKLYKNWPLVRGYLATIGCKKPSSEDVFQEALIIYIRKRDEPDFELTVEPIHYIKSTCKLLWYNQARKERSIIVTQDFEDVHEEIDSDWFKKELYFKEIENALSKIGKQCQEILKSFYHFNLSMVEIAKKLDFRNENVAKAQKYRCINKVKDIVRSNQN